MTHTELHRLSDLRSMIEGFAARNAAAHATTARRKPGALAAILRQLRAAVRARDYVAFRKADATLHETIVLAAEVPMLREAWTIIWNSLQAFHKEGFDKYFPDARVLVEEHEHLVEAISRGDPAAAQDAAQSHVEAVWFRLAEKRREPDEEAPDPLQRATAHLAFQLHCPIRLKHVAVKVAFTSPGNLSHLFRKRYGMSFQRYLQKMRMDKAAELLKTTRLPVGTIARRVGYRDPSRFGQHFRRSFRLTPSRWRKRAKGQH